MLFKKSFIQRGYAALAQFRDVLQQQLTDIKAAGTFKTERILTSAQNTEITVKGSERKILNFCANNYLGLANNVEILNYSREILEKYGAGLSSVREACGTQEIHKTLERKLSIFHEREDTILYATGFAANIGLFESILTKEDAVFSDAYNHASLQMGVRLCAANKHIYEHCNVEDLKQKLETSQARLKLIATEGVFALHGHVAPLQEIVEVAEKYNALILIDDCQATGCFGATGRGTEEYLDLKGHCHIINSTLGKALGGAGGGYTSGCKELIALLRQKSLPYLHSNALSPAVVATGIKVMDILMANSQLTQRLQQNTLRFRSNMAKAGFTIAGEKHPICPVMLDDARLAAIYADQMLSRGIYVISSKYPTTVLKGKAFIRVQISAAHTNDDIDHAVAAFMEVGKTLKVIH